MKVLTTGTLSGLGKHIHETFGGISWTRDLDPIELQKIKTGGVDVIVHCAVNSRQSIDSTYLYDYLSDNVLLTEEVASVPHRKFVLISSVDVYPKHLDRRSEDEAINVNAVDGIYGITKLMSEAVVRGKCPDHLILRCVSLVGKYARKNTLARIIEDEPCTVTLTGDSQFNYILHSDISNLIQFAVENDTQGTFNVATSENVDLFTVAEMLGKQVEFGAHRYDVGNVDNRKIAAIFPAFDRNSKETITRFVGMQPPRS